MNKKEFEDSFVNGLPEDAVEKNKAYLKAFSEDTYGKFLEDLLLPAKCRRLSQSVQFESMNKVQVNFYPDKDKNGKAHGDYNTSIQHIKEVLNDKRLLTVGNLCLDK